LQGTTSRRRPLPIGTERVAGDGTEQNLRIERRDERIDLGGKRQQTDRAKIVRRATEIPGGAEQVAFAHDAHSREVNAAEHARLSSANLSTYQQKVTVKQCRILVELHASVGASGEAPTSSCSNVRLELTLTSSLSARTDRDTSGADEEQRRRLRNARPTGFEDGGAIRTAARAGVVPDCSRHMFQPDTSAGDASSRSLGDR